jgi:hypothetical protein
MGRLQWFIASCECREDNRRSSWELRESGRRRRSQERGRSGRKRDRGGRQARVVQRKTGGGGGRSLGSGRVRRYGSKRGRVSLVQLVRLLNVGEGFVGLRGGSDELNITAKEIFRPE